MMLAANPPNATIAVDAAICAFLLVLGFSNELLELFLISLSLVQEIYFIPLLPC